MRRALALTIKLNRARLAAATGHYGVAEEEFNEIIRRAGAGGGAVEEPLCLALLNKALLYKSLSRFAGAEELCHQALARRSGELSAEHRDLLPYYVALAATELEAGKLDKAQTTVDRARDVCAKQRLENTLLGAQVRHQQALVHFGRYQATTSPADAEAASRLWEELLQLQSQRGWRLEQAHTLHYLARLGFFQWRRKMDEGWRQWRRQQSEQYRQLQSAYQHDCETFQRQLAAYTGDKEKYEAAAEVYARQKGASAQRQQQYRDLLEWRAKLEHAEKPLLAARQDLSARQISLRQAYHACAAHDARGNAAETPRSVSAPWAKAVDPLLANADQRAEQAVQLLADIRLYPNLQYAAICNRAEILRAGRQRCGIASAGDPVLKRRRGSAGTAPPGDFRPRRRAGGVFRAPTPPPSICW